MGCNAVTKQEARTIIAERYAITAQTWRLAVPTPGSGFLTLSARSALIRGGVNVEAELGAQSEALTRAVAELLRIAQSEGTARADITPADVLALLAAIHVADARAAGDGSSSGRMLAVLRDGLRPHPQR
jgi:hypothetical protein